MSNPIKHHKTVSTLPAVLEADSVYYVRVGAGVDLYVTNSTGAIIAQPLNLSLSVVSEVVYTEFYAGGGNDTVQLWARNSSMTQTSTGVWTVAFASPHPDGVNYAPNFEAEEEFAARDTPNIMMVEGSKTVNGFDVMITTGDNGGTADVLVNTPWVFSVTAPVSVVTAVV